MGLHILIIDDNENISSLLRDIVEMAGHKSLVVSAGNEALTALQTEEKFDLVFCDISLPDISGWQVIDAVRERYPGTVMAVISGMGTTLDQEMLESYHIQHVIQKPFQIDEIQAVFRGMES